MNSLNGLALGSALVLLTGVLWAAEAPEVKQLLLQLHDRDISIRQTALRDLNKLGPESADSADLFIAALADDNEEIRQIVTGILAKIGKGAVPGLTKALGQDVIGVRRQALLALGKIGNEAKSAVPGVLESLKDKNKEIRSFALTTLLRIDPDGQAIVPALKQALDDPERGVRLGALYSLEEVVRKKEAIQPLLLEALTNKEWEVRLATAALLSRLGGEIKGALPALLKALHDDDARVRNSVALAVVTLDAKQTAGPLEVLKANLDNKDADIRRGAAYVLGELGAEARSAIPRLKELTRDERPEVRQAALRTLERISIKP